MALPARLKDDHFKPKPRLRSTAHRDWVRGHHCSVNGCTGVPIEVAHVNRASTRGTGQKSSDAFVLALCRDHHSESHRGEKSFEVKYGFRMLAKAEEFYRASPHRRKLDDPYV
jgi:hypothetical protein